MIKFGIYTIDGGADLEQELSGPHSADSTKRALAAAVSEYHDALPNTYLHISGALAVKLLSRAIHHMDLSRQEYNAQCSAEKVAQMKLDAAELALKAAYVQAKRQ